MPSQVCHEHCPPSGHGALVIVVAAGGTGAAIGTYLNEILLVAGSVVVVLAVVGIWYIVHVLRKDRFVTHRAAIMSQAEFGESRLLACDVTAPPGRRRNPALIAEQRKALADGALREPVVLRERLLARQATRDLPAVNPPAQVIGELAPRRDRAVGVDDHEAHGN